MIQRILALPPVKSCFLLGPRQTGKSTLVKSLLGPKDLYINLLPQRNFLTYSKDPERFREEILFHAQKHRHFTCVVDEIQRIPSLLNEIHDLIESHPIRFILTGSSARKLKRGHANLLAGRAYSYQLFPLTPDELGASFQLEKALLYGMLPILWQSETQEDPYEFLRTYTETYLKEEIQEEGVVRNLAPFSRFLDVAAVNDGQIVNFSNIARECGVSVKTAQEYYQILEDTFLAYRLNPWHRSLRKQLVNHPKFYFFDTGVTNSLCHLTSGQLNSMDRGRRFEQWVILQTVAANHYHRLEFELSHWRTHSGAEVDLLLSRSGKIIGIVEIKSTSNQIRTAHIGLTHLQEENPKALSFIVSPHEKGRQIARKITALSLSNFLERLKKL